jgi:hypothetical protein
MAATDTTHECPAPMCEERVPFVNLTCRAHWSLVPFDLQRWLLREYAENFGETSYFEARAACLRALGIPEDQVAGLNAGIV